MTPDKNAAVSADERNNVICRIAKVAKRQGNFQLAAKKYTQVRVRGGRRGRGRECGSAVLRCRGVRQWVHSMEPHDAALNYTQPLAVNARNHEGGRQGEGHEGAAAWRRRREDHLLCG